MTPWPRDELQKIADSDDLHIAPFREDGRTYGTPTWIWSVVVDDGLYARSYNGQSGRWYQAAIQQKAGRITAAGMTKEVTFEPVNGAILDRIDDAYRAKYKASPYLKPMIGTRARAATVKVMPGQIMVGKGIVGMKSFVAIAWLSLAVMSWAQGGRARIERESKPMQTLNDSRMVAPALEKYAQGPIADLWKRPGLTPRDRSIVTISALIARNQTIEMPYYINLALDNGVKPSEISEIITHLAFYSGWTNAMAAVPAVKRVFGERRIGADQLAAASPALLPLEKDSEEQRAARVDQQFGSIAPGLVQYTTDVLFRDLWLRPDLAPRDRSLVTVSALIASSQAGQIPYHLNRAMDKGLTQAQAAEVITHLAFYAGWPNAFTALPIAKEVFENRSR